MVDRIIGWGYGIEGTFTIRSSKGKEGDCTLQHTVKKNQAHHSYLNNGSQIYNCASFEKKWFDIKYELIEKHAKVIVKI